jgi:hypothetical protein
MLDEPRGKPTRGAVGRVRDDEIDERGVVGKKVVSAAPVASIYEVAAHDLKSCSLQDAADGAISAGAFPEHTCEGFARQQSADGAWRCWVKAVRMLVNVVAAVAHASRLRQPGFALRFEAAKSGRPGHTVPIHQPLDEHIGGPSATRFRLIQSETKLDCRWGVHVIHGARHAGSPPGPIVAAAATVLTMLLARTSLRYP